MLLLAFCITTKYNVNIQNNHNHIYSSYFLEIELTSKLVQSFYKLWYTQTIMTLGQLWVSINIINTRELLIS